MIQVTVFNSGLGHRAGERVITVDPEQIKINWRGVPEVHFFHSDFPLGELRAEYVNNEWVCDLD